MISIISSTLPFFGHQCNRGRNVLKIKGRHCQGFYVIYLDRSVDQV